MTHMEQIKIAVRQNDALARALPLLHAFAKFGSPQNFVLSHVLLPATWLAAKNQ
jgi:hypothetical protein